MRWRRPLRVAVGLSGLAFGVGVYLSIGTREVRVRPPAEARLGDSVVLEIASATTQQARGDSQDAFAAKATRQVVYENGTFKSFDVEVVVPGPDEQEFVITGREATGVEKNESIQISGAVRLTSSDGFEVLTENASYAEGIVSAPRLLTFRRGAVSGTGVGMTYDKNTDVLTILDRVHVTFIGAGEANSMELTGGAATYVRRDHLLIVERDAKLTRGAEEAEGERATARLSETDDAVTHVEVRGAARVTGGSSAVRTMSADVIDLDYSDDGVVLERVELNGNGAVAFFGHDDSPGREFFGNALTVMLRADTSVASVAGRGGVRLVLPAAPPDRWRQISARAMDATGEAGLGLTAAKFSGDVELREDPVEAGSQPRVVSSQTLHVGLTNDTITDVILGGGVRFVEQELSALAPEAVYDPGLGTLRLGGANPAGRSRLADDRVTIDADTIDLVLDERRVTARGAVKTVLLATAQDTSNQAPQLFDGNQVININGNTLEYDGAAAQVSYDGDVQIWQGDNAIRADTAVIDRGSGDVRATGNARSVLIMDGETSTGRGEEIRYTDDTRQIEYNGTVSPAQLSSPMGTLVGTRITVALEESGARVVHLEASGAVTLQVDSRRATGERLIYDAADEQYVLNGTPGVPAHVAQACEEVSGHTLTFFRSAGRLFVDGNEETRTQATSGGGPCSEPRSP
jgi:lipopolysaccharide transport protein LptA